MKESPHDSLIPDIQCLVGFFFVLFHIDIHILMVYCTAFGFAEHDCDLVFNSHGTLYKHYCDDSCECHF